MLGKWRWLLSRLTRRLWIRATAIGLLGVAAAVLAIVADRFIPWDMPTLGANAVDTVLGIIASSMLAVTTFSLSVVTAAYSSATSNVTPRATQLIMEDSVTQNTLATFVGSFLFSLVGIIVLQTGAYGEQGRTVLFVFTVAVVALIVVMLLRWIDHLNSLGRVADTTARVERATRKAMEARLKDRWLGGVPATGPAGRPGRTPLLARDTGYVQHVDMARLQDLAEDAGARLHLAILPGAFVCTGQPVAFLEGDLPDPEDAARAFTIGSGRSFDQDPRFGMIVLSEVASRALSPAINDSGTAIDVIGRGTRLLLLWAEGLAKTEPRPPRFARVVVPDLVAADLFDDLFTAIARDGAGVVQVQIRLQKALAALGGASHPEYPGLARDHALSAFARAERAMDHPGDIARLRVLLP
ncbi:DUF2254 domain-containing protein [Falsirhodobacter algicola]|uniref:DUF2254 domain-containing protein n=1 Tax=Falsirhodobacter algicola TaxID=2692330 RepID=A0A8J8SJQ8_9RHOB|nr:DUF2254 domain-containing protein [Falsirhodobacter algicola]QUS35065.1 DUF2254 domain-containing protein [Falsirhodobacter algicola]